jgi:uncharacterized protein
VGSYVVIRSQKLLLFASVTSVSSQPESDQEPRILGTGVLELLTAVSSAGENGHRGVNRFPHPGSKIYTAPPELLRWLFESNQLRETASAAILLDLGSLTNGTQIRLTPERLFGRHCAGFGRNWCR